MKTIFKAVQQFFLNILPHKKQTVNSDILANLELALSFNHAVFLEYKQKTGHLKSFTASITNITERQVVTLDVNSQQMRIILLSQIKKVTFNQNIS